MKLIKAIVQRHALPAVTEALAQLANLPGIMVAEIACLDLRHAPDHPDVNATLEMIVPDTRVEEVVSTIHRASHSGRPGDGGILVLPIERFVNIRDEVSP